MPHWLLGLEGECPDEHRVRSVWTYLRGMSQMCRRVVSGCELLQLRDEAEHLVFEGVEGGPGAGDISLVGACFQFLNQVGGPVGHEVAEVIFQRMSRWADPAQFVGLDGLPDAFDPRRQLLQEQRRHLPQEGPIAVDPGQGGVLVPDTGALVADARRFPG